MSIKKTPGLFFRFYFIDVDFSSANIVYGTSSSTRGSAITKIPRNNGRCL